MQKVAVAAMLLLSSTSFAKTTKKTVSECTKDLSRAIFGLGDKKYEQACRKYSQATIDCAVEEYRQKSLGRTFDNALEDCDRKSDE